MDRNTRLVHKSTNVCNIRKKKFDRSDRDLKTKKRKKSEAEMQHTTKELVSCTHRVYAVGWKLLIDHDYKMYC